MGFFKWLREVFMGAEQDSCEVASGLAKKIKVKVVMDKDGVCWNYALEADDNASDPYVKAGNKIDMGSGPGSGAEIEFRLQGKAGQKLDFQPGDPIWIAVGSCPPAPTPTWPAGVSLVSCTNDKLTIADENRNPAADLHYRLNFVDSTTGQPLSWDPIIRNGGGGP
jgi:hypothetical protein